MKSYLVLESGEVFLGTLQTQHSPSLKVSPKVGEIVFNTSHTGYEEIATDPSYLSQIVVMTAPMQGNYGANSKCWESSRIWIEGFICLQVQNSKRDRSWIETLEKHNVPLFSDIDTRDLVFVLRSKGSCYGALLQAESVDEALCIGKKSILEKRMIEKDWVWLASRKEPVEIKGLIHQGPRIAVLDFGSKENIIREALKRSSCVKIFPSRTAIEDILEFNPSAVLLTNGPGDPSDVEVAPETIKKLIGKLPIYGICMGHQLLCLALGAKTYKMKFGHRGSNHPIRDGLLNQVYVSSQNHGYAVEEKSLPESVVVTHRNLNDQTVAGIYSKKLQLLGIQYHPESCPGPHEAVMLFDFFFSQIANFEIKDMHVSN